MTVNAFSLDSTKYGAVRMQKIILPISGKYNCQPLYGPHFLLIRNEAALIAGCPLLDDEDVVEKPESEFEVCGAFGSGLDDGCAFGSGLDDGCGIKSETGRCCGPVLRFAVFRRKKFGRLVLRLLFCGGLFSLGFEAIAFCSFLSEKYAIHKFNEVTM